MPRSDRSPSDQRLITTVARRYYLDDESKVQIASDLGISRFKVARLLDEARATGVVRIEIAPEAGSDEARGDRLASALGLTRAVVVDLSLVGSRARRPTRAPGDASSAGWPRTCCTRPSVRRTCWGCRPHAPSRR
ncbi:hypothetical protein [Barrientosiimonas endolithica]|uniref:Sugar-binding domain-containing protein n=1 Tax=Barrientosiimonas endolithica TaxID=1535208 RepID=A0ABM8HBM6_9MICO|nr:hypothetical protein [Barrientosiimonas endolithica]BDZ58362.1 hypothetical protein GCM10025872_20190 [Barrientosiimonas endolithica]